MKKLIGIGLCAGSALLAGCSGSDSVVADTSTPATVTPPVVTTPAAPTTDVPTSATASIPGLIAYLQQLIAGTSDTTDPILVGTAVLPTDESTETSIP